MNTLIVVIAVVLWSLGTIAAQEQEQSFAGFMDGVRANAVKGDVVYQHNDATFPLESALKLEDGDVVKTSPNAYAELLLQPGSYLRIAGDTELQIVNNQHDRMKFKLNRGTVSFEILSRDNLSSFYDGYEARYLIRVIIPGTEVFIMEPGIFRLTTQPGQTELVARKGAAVIKGHEVKEKRRAVVSGDDVSITEIDMKSEDSFDTWARERAETLVRANKSLKKTPLWANKKETEEAPVDMPEQAERRGSPMVVSARPGTVNFAEEGVEFSHAPKEWQELTEKTQLEAGDRLRTAANTFAELELFPDMHLRLGASSEVLLEQLSNDAVSINMVNGSAILDIARFDRKQAPQITIAAGIMAVTVVDSGNYRVDNDAITIRGGKVRLNDRTIGSCHTIAAGVISDCDKKRTDNFDYWSRYAGEGESYGGFSMASYLANSRRVRFRNTGFWFQNPEQTSYTFVPFSSEFFRSPYGGNYSTVLSPRRRLNPGGNRGEFRLPRLGSQTPTKP
jgi:hypothetical protein